jgi:methylmalonyl-CoA mutase C-terminal domain/subunit
MIAEAALQEDVDVVGLSILSGAHMALTPYHGAAQGQRPDAGEGIHWGIVPDDDVARLKELGITGIYGPGASTETIVRGSVRQ